MHSWIRRFYIIAAGEFEMRVIEFLDEWWCLQKKMFFSKAFKSLWTFNHYRCCFLTFQLVSYYWLNIFVTKLISIFVPHHIVSKFSFFFLLYMITLNVGQNIFLHLRLLRPKAMLRPTSTFLRVQPYFWHKDSRLLGDQKEYRSTTS